MSKNFKNTIWSVANSISLPFLMIIVTPFFIKELGAEQYGIWILIKSITSGFALLNLGGADATIKFISKYLGERKKKDVYRIIQTTLTLNGILAFATIIIGLLLVEIIARFNLLSNISLEYRESAIHALRFSSAIFGLKLIEQIYISVYKGFQRYDSSTKLNILSKISTISVQFLVVFYGGGIDDIFKFTFFIVCISIIIEHNILKRYLKDLKIQITLKKDSFKEVFDFGLWAWIYSLLGICASQLDKIIIGAWVNTVELAYFSIGFLVYSQMHSVFSSSVSWIFPKISQSGKIGIETKRTYFDLQLITIGFGTFCILCIFFLRNIIFKIWLDEDTFYNSINYISAFLCLNLVILPTIVPYYLLNGGGYIKLNTYFKFFIVIVNIISISIGFKLGGIYGIIIGKFFSPIIISSINRSIVHKKILEIPDYLSGFYLLCLPFLITGIFIKLQFDSTLNILSIIFFMLFLITVIPTMLSFLKLYVIKK